MMYLSGLATGSRFLWLPIALLHIILYSMFTYILIYLNMTLYTNRNLAVYTGLAPVIES